MRRPTGRDKVVLIGGLRGGDAVRNYQKDGGGAAYVLHAILSVHAQPRRIPLLGLGTPVTTRNGLERPSGSAPDPAVILLKVD